MSGEVRYRLKERASLYRRSFFALYGEIPVDTAVGAVGGDLVTNLQLHIPPEYGGQCLPRSEQNCSV